MITKVGKNFIRDLLCGTVSGSNLDKGGLGTIQTSPTEDDTGLNSNSNYGVSDTINNITYSTSDKQVVFDYTLLSTESTGVTFRECGLNSATAKLFNRQTFYGLTHDSTEEWQMSVAVSIE